MLYNILYAPYAISYPLAYPSILHIGTDWSLTYITGPTGL